MVMPSTPALPLLAFTCCNACFRFSRSHTSSIHRFVLGGLSGSCIAESDSVSSLFASQASPAGEDKKSSVTWVFFCRLSLLRFMSYLPLLLVPAFGHRSRLSLSVAPPFGSECLTSFADVMAYYALSDFCPAVRRPCDPLSRRSDAEQISWGKLNRLPCTVAESTLRALDGYGLRDKLPARPALTPCIRFLSIDSHVCSMLPSDPASRR